MMLEFTLRVLRSIRGLMPLPLGVQLEISGAPFLSNSKKRERVLRALAT